MSDFYLHFTLGLPHLYTMLTLYDCTYVLSQHFFLSSSVIGRITLHGFPTATLSEGISFTTTLPAPITTLLPIVTPGITCTPAPNHTLFPTLCILFEYLISETPLKPFTTDTYFEQYNQPTFFAVKGQEIVVASKRLADALLKLTE